MQKNIQIEEYHQLEEWWENATEEQKEIRKQEVKKIKQWLKDYSEHIRNLRFLNREIISKGDKEINRLWNNWEKEVPKFRDFCHYDSSLKDKGYFNYYIQYHSNIKTHQWFRLDEYRESCGLNKWDYLYVLQEEFRHRCIAWSLLKGKTYDQIEQPHEDNQPNWRKINEYIGEYTRKLCPETLCVSS